MRPVRDSEDTWTVAGASHGGRNDSGVRLGVTTNGGTQSLPAPADGNTGDGSASTLWGTLTSSVFLTDAERVVLVSCMEMLDGAAPAASGSSGARKRGSRGSPTLSGGGRKDTSVSTPGSESESSLRHPASAAVIGKVISSKSAVLVSLLSMHVMVRAVLVSCCWHLC